MLALMKNENSREGDLHWITSLIDNKLYYQLIKVLKAFLMMQHAVDVGVENNDKLKISLHSISWNFISNYVIIKIYCWTTWRFPRYVHSFVYLFTCTKVFLRFHETTAPYKLDHLVLLVPVQYHREALLFGPKLLRPILLKLQKMKTKAKI